MTALEPIYRRDGDAFAPTAQARGPWDAGQQHGGAPGALIATHVQALAPDMQVARLTYDFLGPVPLEPCTVSAQVIKPGKRFQLATATLSAGGRTVIEARAVLLRRGEVHLPELARWQGDDPPPGPDQAEPKTFPARPGGPDEGFHLTGIDIRYAAGSIAEAGPATAWFTLERDLVEGEPTPPMARAIAAADFGNGVSRVLEFHEHLFVNTDLTVHLLRDPRGESVCLDAVTRIDDRGVGLATSVLHDEDGPIGYAHQTLFVADR